MNNTRKLAAVKNIIPIYPDEIKDGKALIDKGIAKIIDILNNKLGIKTLASCSGLKSDHWPTYSNAQFYIWSEKEFPADIQQKIRQLGFVFDGDANSKVWMPVGCGKDSFRWLKDDDEQALTKAISLFEKFLVDKSRKKSVNKSVKTDKR